MTEPSGRFWQPTRGRERSTWIGAFGYTVLGQVVLGVVRLGCLALVGRVAGKEALGEVSVILAVSTFLVLLWPQPAGAASARFLALSTGDVARQQAVLGFTSLTVLISALPMGLFGALVASTWLDLGSPTVYWAALLPICLGMATYARGTRGGRLYFRQGFWWDCFGAIATAATLIALLATGQSQHALAAFCVGFLASAVPGWPRARLHRAPTAARSEVVRYTAWTSVQVVSAGGLIHVAMALAAVGATATQLGEMGAAVSVATPILLLSVALRTSTVPFVVRQAATGDQSGLRTSTDLLLRAMVVLFVPAFGVACLWARQILELLYSDQFAQGSTLLIILLLGVSLNCFNASHVWLMSGPSWGVRVLAVCNGAGLATGVLVALLHPSSAATTSAALGYLAGSLVSAVATTAVVWRSGAMPWSAVLGRLTAGYALIVASLIVSSDMDAVPRLVVTVCFLAVVYAATRTDVNLIRRAAPWRLRQAT